MLEVSHLEAGYGRVQVLRGVSFHVNQRELVCILGANGAGKTTILRAISGLLPPWSGSIRFEGIDIHRYPPDKIVELGIVHIPEGRKLFTDMTVLENLELGAFTKNARRKMKENLAMCFDLFPVLKERAKQPVGSMSGGQQQMVAIARGLMSQPKLLILDEPSIGLSPLLTKQMFEILREIRSRGVTLLLVEQNVQQALSLADRGYVLENGSVVLEGTAEELINNQDLKKAYLGA